MSGFSVRILLDSLAPCGKRLTTVVARFPRIILSEVNTHRDRARNAASSRAIPFPVMTANIESDPFVPLIWGAEQSGMQAAGPIPEKMWPLAELIWRQALEDALANARRLHHIGELYGKLHPDIATDEDRSVKIHKSLPNRIVEPWMWCEQVMTATEWENFFRLRCHADAEVHFQRIARMIRAAMRASTPQPPPAIIGNFSNGEATEEREERWHLPFVTGNDLEELLADHGLEEIRRISVARCARVSYLSHDGVRDPRKDLTLFERLVQGSGFGHWSAHEHVALACETEERSGPFVGWRQYRKSFALENLPG